MLIAVDLNVTIFLNLSSRAQITFLMFLSYLEQSLLKMYVDNETPSWYENA